MYTSGAWKRGRSSHLKIIIYCFSFQSFVNLQKESWQAAQFRLRMQEVRTWTTMAPGCSPADMHWHPKQTPLGLLLPSEMLQFLTQLLTWHPWVTGQVMEWCRGCFGLGVVGFFSFFALLLENEIFSSFLKNKLVNKLILFCFYFTQSFIFNPIPEKQNC